MGELIRRKDWSQTPLGPVERWPQSLRTTVSLCLASNFPINLIWGPEHIQIYNDGYMPICAGKHPKSLGEDYTKTWASAWDILEDAFERALAGHTSFLENERMFLDRNGYLEETFFTFSLSPIRDESGGIGGLFHPVTETTPQILSQRRTRALQDLASRGGRAKSVEEACQLSIGTLAEYPLDLPFVLLYVLDQDGKRARLTGNACLDAHTAASPVIIMLDGSGSAAWPFEEVIATGMAIEVKKLEERFGTLPCGPYPESPDTAVMSPLSVAGMDRPLGILIAGASPRLPFNQEYRVFCDLIAAGVTAAITNARAYEEERKRAEVLADLDRAKTTFFSNVSHEFRTPLTLMLGPLEEMLASVGESIRAERKELDLVYRNGLRLLRLVNTLLDFSRIEANRVQAVYEPVDLAALTRDLAAVFRSAAEKAGLTLAVDCPALTEPIYLDRQMWEKIVLNLISNAYKFTFEGTIGVTLRELAEEIEVSVSDTGTGIPANELPNVFKRFHRVQGSQGRTYEGTGIGLALVADLVKLHSGSVRVASELGIGSTFTVKLRKGSRHLPKEQVSHSASTTSSELNGSMFVEEALRWASDSEPNERAAAGASTRRSTALERRKILLADDNADMRQYIQNILGREFEIEAVANGAEALDRSRREVPDLVLTDVMMPELDGFALLAALRKEAKTQAVPVILLSARAGEEARIEGIEAGADDYLVKPFSARELMARVRVNMELAQLRQKLAREEEERRTSEERERQWRLFDTALSHTPDFTYIFDPEGRLLYANRTLLTTWQRSLDDVLGKKVFDGERYPREVAAKLYRQIQQVVDTRVPIRDATPLTEPNGMIRYYEYIFVPVFAADGKVEAVAGSTRDMTEHRQIEEALRKANFELEEFAFVASHDLQEPLRMVNTYTQILLQRFGHLSDPKAREYASFIEEGVHRMEALIGDVLFYSKTIHSHDEELATVKLSGIVRQALSGLHDQIEESGAKITYENLPAVRGDQAQLTHVFQNLLSNALKYRRRGEPLTVQIAACQTEAAWVISVRDNGIGFEQEYAERIFGLFKRLHRSEYPGTGLGLAICKRIVERHGGRIWAQSELQVGSTFFFSLPVYL